MIYSQSGEESKIGTDQLEKATKMLKQGKTARHDQLYYKYVIRP